jgi:hypothetical protein
MVRPAISPTPLRQDHGPERWTPDADGSVSGLVVSAAVLQAGAEATVEFVLHEAAHILCWRRDVKDTTMRGVYAVLRETIPTILPHLSVPAPVTESRGRLTLQCRCDPPRKVRVGKTIAALGPIICGICDHEFQAE